MSTPSDKPPIAFFLHENGISVYPPTGGRRTLFRPEDPQELEKVIRDLLQDENLTPEEKDREVQRLVKNAREQWPPQAAQDNPPNKPRA